MFDDLINWMGLRACDGFAAIGVSATCSATNNVFGMGLITFAVVLLFVVGAATVFARR
jgi:hypothetical protein